MREFHLFGFLAVLGRAIEIFVIAVRMRSEAPEWRSPKNISGASSRRLIRRALARVIRLATCAGYFSTIQIFAAMIDLMAPMKRSLLILFAIILVLGTYAASPYLGLRRIISAVHARNALALSDSVDFDRLRVSLTGQVVERYLQLTGRTARLGSIGNVFAVAIGTSIADPIVAQILNPEGLIDLLEKGDAISGSQQIAFQFGPFSNPGIGSVWDALSNSDYGLGRFFISLPTSVPPRDQFRLELQMLQWQWKLISIGLPEQLRTQLAAQLARQIP